MHVVQVLIFLLWIKSAIRFLFFFFSYFVYKLKSTNVRCEYTSLHSYLKTWITLLFTVISFGCLHFKNVSILSCLANGNVFDIRRYFHAQLNEANISTYFILYILKFHYFHYILNVDDSRLFLSSDINFHNQLNIVHFALFTINCTINFYESIRFISLPTDW